MKFRGCDEASPAIQALLDGELAPDERGDVEAHLATCASCRSERDELAALAKVLRAHLAARAETQVTIDVLAAIASGPAPATDRSNLDTQAMQRAEKPQSLDELKARIKPRASERVPTERAEADTNAIGVSGRDPRSLVGTTLAGYRIDGEIARGGMGTVYRATQLSMDRAVALKVLSQKLSLDDVYVKRFLNEARAAATIDHPNIIRVFEVGEAKGEIFFSMELVDGEDAEGVVFRDGPLAPRRAVEIALETARALEAAHARNVVHRDVKPANILLVRGGGAKLADLGLARVEEAEGDARITMKPIVMGSPNYMPPEQARDARDVDARGDVYGLGSTLLHLISGERPFGGGAPMDVLSRVVGPEPPAIPASVKGNMIDAGLRAVLLRAMEKDRERRYQTMRELREDLEAWLENEPLAALAPREDRVAKRAQTGRRGRTTPRGAAISTRQTTAAVRAYREPRADVARNVGIVLTAVVVLGVIAVVAKKGATPPEPEPAPVVKKPEPPPPDPTPAPPPEPTTIKLIPPTVPPPKPAPPKPETPPEPPRERDPGASDLADVLREVDRLRGLDRWGDALAALEKLIEEKREGPSVDRARAEARDLKKRIDERLAETLSRAEALGRKGERVKAEDLLAGVEDWGDALAKEKARAMRAGLAPK